ncbi:hypothetical protein [Massilia arenae]|uniref:Uncharacterized protein n=1 Tax=Massilia arenae TaxID=2603288 RepID=A0A5C7G7A7_9BURK|nr:hypothetical protein [Massilia arenae]TXG01903.1 hypothetical protein FVD38_01610 [Massilia arenae]
MPVAAIQYPTDIVNYNNNGGYHRQGKRAYRNAVRKITDCLPLYREARLYHLCFEGKTHPEHMKMLHALGQMATRAGIECEWFAAREVADGTKADHLHVFMLIDAHGNNVWKVFNQFDDGQVGQLCNDKGIEFAIFSPKDFQGIHGRNNYMALPYQGPGNRETALGRKRLADALVWLSYNYKARSKPQDDKKWQIFPASRPTRKAPAAAQEAPTVTNPSPSVDPSTGKANHTLTEKETQHEGSTTEGNCPESSSQGEADSSQGEADSTSQDHSGLYTGPSSNPELGSSRPRPRIPAPSASGPSTEAQARPGQAHGGATGPAGEADLPITHPYIDARKIPVVDSDPVLTTGEAMTPADRYIAAKYEAGVDAKLDLDAMRRFLLAHGIRRTPAQVVHELDSVYGFYEYTSRHPAPAVVDVTQLDRAIDRMKNGDVKRLPIPSSVDGRLRFVSELAFVQLNCG